MPRKELVLDGLWYCLCPSFSLGSLSRPGIPLIKGRRLPAPPLSQRCYSSSSSSSPADSDDCVEPTTTRQSTVATHSSIRPRYLARRPPQGSAGVPKTLAGQSTADLESKLQELAVRSPKVISATQILRILIRDRHVRPGVRHYRALILANTDAERGSPEVLRGLLEEMERSGIPADSGTLHAALQVLAVHPDYLLRQEILRTMRDRWLTLSPAGWHYVVAGLLREHQFELALVHIGHMERKDIMVEGWLHSLLVYNLCDFEEFDEVLRLMQSWVNQGYDMSVELWMYVLDVASAALHGETTRYVWTQTVQLGYLKPPHEICSNILAVASHTADTELAASVVRYLAESDTPLESEDFECLVETHVRAGSLSAAFEVLCSMHKAGIELEENTTRPINEYLIEEKIRPRDAWNLLKWLKVDHKHEIPPACAKVVIEICEHEAQNDPFAVDDGIGLYKELYSLCSGGADVSIYNTLISMCRRAQNRNAAMFVVKEMALLGVVPNGGTFERLILMCLDAGNFQSAYMYFQDMLERGFEPEEEAQSEIRDHCSGASDNFAIQLKYHPKIRGDLVRTKEPGDALVPKERIKKPSTDRTRRRSERTQPQPQTEKDDRWAALRKNRKAKRRRLAITRAQEEEGWQDYQPGLLEPEVRFRENSSTASSGLL